MPFQLQRSGNVEEVAYLGCSVAKKYKNKHPWPEGTGGAEKYRDELLYSWHFDSRSLLAPAGSQDRFGYLDIAVTEREIPKSIHATNSTLVV
jgi:hypothetical protein